jgi:DNA-binding NtrC family response regulator
MASRRSDKESSASTVPMSGKQLQYDIPQGPAIAPVDDEALTSQVGTGVAPSFHVLVVRGPDAGKEASAIDGRLTIGTMAGNTLVLSDRTVSRFHLDLEITDKGVTVRDLGSTNGTRLGSAYVRDLTLRNATELALGETLVKVLGASRSDLRSAPELERAEDFRSLVGNSPQMSAVRAKLAQAAPVPVPVLIVGESGTGKEVAARAVHSASKRASKPFEVVDCGGLPPTLAESELFGHERGAFTSASGEREGAFERADGGTLFLDELGELPLDVQPKLLRALGEREVKRVGGKKARKVDVRLVAATNRDLRRAVNEGRFREDLYHRIAVIEIRMPPLRSRLEDLDDLVPALLEAIRKDRDIDVSLDLTPELYASLRQRAWSGNVRELRNYLESLAIVGAGPETVAGERMRAAGNAGELLRLDHAMDRFEREYVERLLETTGGNVADAARRAGVDRRTLFRMIRKHGIRRDGT